MEGNLRYKINAVQGGRIEVTCKYFVFESKPGVESELHKQE